MWLQRQRSQVAVAHATENKTCIIIYMHQYIKHVFFTVYIQEQDTETERKSQDSRISNGQMHTTVKRKVTSITRQQKQKLKHKKEMCFFHKEKA